MVGVKMSKNAPLPVQPLACIGRGDGVPKSPHIVVEEEPATWQDYVDHLNTVERIVLPKTSNFEKLLIIAETREGWLYVSTMSFYVYNTDPAVPKHLADNYLIGCQHTAKLISFVNVLSLKKEQYRKWRGRSKLGKSVEGEESSVHSEEGSKVEREEQKCLQVKFIENEQEHDLSLHIEDQVLIDCIWGTVQLRLKVHVVQLYCLIAIYSARMIMISLLLSFFKSEN